MESTIEYICRHEGDGAVLVFLTGWDDISKLLDQVKANSFLRDPSKFLVLPVHGSMPTVNQRAIFDRPPANIRYPSFCSDAILCCVIHDKKILISSMNGLIYFWHSISFQRHVFSPIFSID